MLGTIAGDTEGAKEEWATVIIYTLLAPVVVPFVIGAHVMKNF